MKKPDPVPKLQVAPIQHGIAKIRSRSIHIGHTSTTYQMQDYRQYCVAVLPCLLVCGQSTVAASQSDG